MITDGSGWSPMAPLEREAAIRLAELKFAPDYRDAGFVRSMARMARTSEPVISEKQRIKLAVCVLAFQGSCGRRLADEARSVLLKAWGRLPRKFWTTEQHRRANARKEWYERNPEAAWRRADGAGRRTRASEGFRVDE